LRPPRAPAVLVLATTRPGHAPELPCAPRAIALGPLLLEDARRLALHLLDGGSDMDIEALTREAEGHPLFIAELARHARTRTRSAPTLDDALGARIGELSPESEGLLALLAVARGPLERATLVHASAQ